MLIVYKVATGEVVDNTGTNSAMPEGPPHEMAFINTDSRGLNRNDLALLRLNDQTDAALVADILENRCHVDVSVVSPVVVIDGPYPRRDLTTDTDTIPADGTTPATVTYLDTHEGAPSEVVFTVNAALATVALIDGKAVLEVTTSQAGPVDVSVDTLPTTLAITATEVPA
jgi:hypothetical protein